MVQNISAGILVHSLKKFAFRSSKLGGEIVKTFAFKILQIKNTTGLKGGELVRHSSEEMKAMSSFLCYFGVLQLVGLLPTLEESHSFIQNAFFVQKFRTHSAKSYRYGIEYVILYQILEKTRVFATFCHHSTHHQGLWISRLLNNSSQSITVTTICDKIRLFCLFNSAQLRMGSYLTEESRDVCHH